MEINIYPLKNKVFERELNKLETWNISDKNKELIKAFHNYLFAQGSGELRVAKLSVQLRIILNIVNKDLSEFEQQDVENIIANINRDKKLYDATKSDYRRVIKQFFKWFKKKDIRLENNETKKLK